VIRNITGTSPTSGRLTQAQHRLEFFCPQWASLIPAVLDCP
jgi:hypothetical protein